MGLMAGSAVVDITPKSPCHLAGYGGRDHAHEGIHDPLSLRALYVRGASGDALLVSADLLWFYEDMIERMEAVLERELGLKPSDVLFCGTHTHSAPTVSRERVNHEWRTMVEKQAVAAAALAHGRLKEVSLGVGRGSCDIGINRREQKPTGEVVLGKNPEGTIDRELIVLAFDGPEGEPVARIASFACHGVVLSGRNYQISGDWLGMAAAKIEAGMSRAAMILLNGGAANVNPVVGPQEDFEPVEAHAGEFVDSYSAACGALQAVDGQDDAGGADLEILMPRKLRDVEDGRGKFRPLRIRGLRIGPLRIVGHPGEVFSETTMAVKAASPHKLTMVNSYTGGGSGGYVPVAEAYETGGYEVRVTPYAEGAESVLRRGFLDLLEKL